MILLLMVVKENFSRSQTDYDCYRYGTFQSGAHQLLGYVHVIFTAAEALRSRGLVELWCVFLFFVLCFSHLSLY